MIPYKMKSGRLPQQITCARPPGFFFYLNLLYIIPRAAVLLAICLRGGGIVGLSEITVNVAGGLEEESCIGVGKFLVDG